jgi:DNA-binding response OmpR family regulator
MLESAAHCHARLNGPSCGIYEYPRPRSPSTLGFVTRVEETASSTVLLVDDEPAVLELCAACLRNAGFTVMVAANGLDAQAVLQESPGSIGLLITDVEIPFVSGPELADSVAARGSSCPVLLMSGKLAPPEVAEKGWEFLAKPFTPSVLVATVRRLLSRVAARPRALLAEDDSEMRAHLCDLLEDEYDLVAVLDGGATVVQKSEELHPDVIILDISMPDVSGLAVARSLRESIPRIPVVFVTQHTGSAYIEAAFANGASGYVTKPRIFSELCNALRQVRGGARYLSSGLRAE